MSAVLKDRDVHDAADGVLRQDALDNLTERLKRGDRVGRCTLGDLIRTELDQHFDTAVQSVIDIVVGMPGECQARIERWENELISSYLATHADFVEEEADRIEHYREEDAFIDAAIERAREP